MPEVYSGNIVLTKQFDTVLTLPLSGLYSDKNAEFTIEAASGVPTFSGGALTGSTTITGTSCDISSSTNNSGISVAATCAVTRAEVDYASDVEGWLSCETGDTAYASGSQNIASGTYYINGVTLTAPASGSISFSITVPNGNSTTTFIFNVDSNGNVVVSES